MSIHNDSSIPNPRKRTRVETDESEIDTAPFTIRDPSDPFARPRTFTPLQLISRAQLPLSCLDPAPLASGRLFSAHVRALEAAHEYRDDATVLLARDEKEQRLYAVERVSRGIYAICRLVQDLRNLECFETCQDVVQPVQPPIKRRALQSMESGQSWWSHAAVAIPASTRKETTIMDLPKLAMHRVVETPQPAEEDTNIEDPKLAIFATSERPTENAPIHVNSQMITRDVLQELSKQYLDALYLSRTSLAYFTKGPLSRARAAFSTGSGLTVTTLIEFLRETILTSGAMDKKYKDGISNIVKELSPPAQVNEDGQPPGSIKKKSKKRKWKAKRDKAGLFVDEPDFIERWWQNEEHSGSVSIHAETCDEGLRRRLPKIRNRETFLQIILILEVLALETCNQSERCQAKASVVDSQAPETQDLDSQPAETQKLPQPKKKKPQDLSALLDTLLDKLCIWHSLLDSNSPGKTRDNNASTGQEEPNDELRSFCVELVVPFYVPRIPYYATTVNRKLGGPSAPTPISRKTTSSSKARPGEPAARKAPEKAARAPLSRVESEILNHATKHRTPNLQRSATDSSISEPLIKREGSESIPPMDSIPAAKAPRKRANLMQNLSFSKREVDLSAMSQASEAKLKKKAEVEEKLREAISTLKKPNRAMAVKEIAESTDAKVTASKTKSQREKKVVQSTPIHVTATPGSKYARAVKGTPYQKRTSYSSGANANSQMSEQSFEAVPAGTPAVPQTAHRPRQSSYGTMAPVDKNNALAVPQTGHRPRYISSTNIEETPSRGFAKFMPAGLARQPGTLDSPIASRNSSVLFQTPSKSGSASRFVGIAATPVRPLAIASPNSKIFSGARSRDHGSDGVDMTGKSIYEQLGWNDNDAEELL